MRAVAMWVVAMLSALVLWVAIVYGNAWLGVVNLVLLLTPVEVGRVGLELVGSGELVQHLLMLLRRVAQGFGLAALAAFGLGLLVGMCVLLRFMAEPVIEFVRPIPLLVFLLMFLVWFGFGEASKIAFIGYTIFFPMFVAITASVLCVDVILLRAAVSLGAFRSDLVRCVVLLAALLGIVVGLRLGVGLALFVIVGAEFMGADAGLGHLIMEGRMFFNPVQIVMGALVLGLLGSLINLLLLVAERWLLRWRAAV